jgi:ligand-binding sensor domain-containing protein
MRNCTKNPIFTLVLLVAILFSGFTGKLHAQAQASIPIGGWKMHLPYQNCKYITGSSTYMWAATDDGLFKLNKSDNTVERITKIDGLSDLIIGAIGYNASNDVLVVGYKNGNLDIIKGNKIYNLPDIKRAQIIADKAIYNIYFVGSLAYISTGFGIVVIDTDRDEVKDTYVIGPNGIYLTVYDVISDGVTLYAATESGIYYAPINDQYLSNFATWTKFVAPLLPTGIFNSLAIYNNNLVAAYSTAYPVSYAGVADKVCYYDLSTQIWDTLHGFTTGHHIHDMFTQNNLLYFSDLDAIYELGTNLQSITNFYSYDGSNYLMPGQIYVDQQNIMWSADFRKGMLKFSGSTMAQSFYPNGPNSTDAYAIAESEGHLVVVPGGHDDAWNNVFNKEGFSNYNAGIWTNTSGTQNHAFDTLQDLVAAAIDPANPNHFFMGTWGWGVVEMNNGAIAHVWDNSNSTLLPKVEYQWVGIGDMKYDTSGNLWVTNSHALTALNVYKPDGTWQAFDFTGYIPVGTTVSKLLVTKSGKKWMILPRGQGMLVFDDNGTLANTSDDQKRKLGFSAGLGNIPGTDVYSMAEDDDGNVWIGTDKGIAVFYCADNIFSQSGCEAQQILITQDTYVQILLETQSVTAIIVDGANRKWIGTDGGGVYLFSPDGQKQLEHFTSENSPLLSDNITSMSMDEKTGEVYFGTSKGIVSYRGEAITGEDHMGDVYSFPNPVTPDYHGPIAITGLVKDADVKIADVRGNVVFKTTALGGQAIWDGNNFQGERAASGVYIVFISNEDGSEKAVTKILLIN